MMHGGDGMEEFVLFYFLLFSMELINRKGLFLLK